MNHEGGISSMNMTGVRRPHYTHMTFFWGKNSAILFTGWPGASGGMYAPAALAFVFALALLVEWLHHRRLVRSRPAAANGALTQTVLLHAVHVGLSYLLMLAVMSFNGGVFIVAVVGHALGFLFFGSVAFRNPTCGGMEDLAPLAAR